MMMAATVLMKMMLMLIEDVDGVDGCHVDGDGCGDGVGDDECDD